MPRTLSLIVWPGLVAALFAAAAWAQDAFQTPADHSAPQPPVEDVRSAAPGGIAKDPAGAGAPLVTEITEIREQQGSLLSGSLLESISRSEAGADPGADDFEAALSEIVERSSGQAAFAPDVQYPDVHRPEGQSLSATGDGLVALLRETSRALDARSHDLEAARQFRQADELDRLARRLRRQARLLEAGR